MFMRVPVRVVGVVGVVRVAVPTSTCPFELIRVENADLLDLRALTLLSPLPVRVEEGDSKLWWLDCVNSNGFEALGLAVQAASAPH